MFDPNVFQANQAAIPYDAMLALDGRCVAWSFDGATPLAVGPDWAGLYAEVDRLGVKDFVPAFVDLSPVQFGSAGLLPDESTSLARAG